MFASSSSPLRAISTSSLAQSSRQFSSSAPIAARRKELVELLRDHEHLGRKRDRVMVSPGYARNKLVPYQWARWVPNWRLYKIGPYRYVPAMSDALQITAPDGTSTYRAPKRAESTPQDLLSRIAHLPTSLEFKRHTTQDGRTLHGSLTLTDIAQRLAELGLAENEVEVSWEQQGNQVEGGMEEGGVMVGDRMKAVGERIARVQVRGKGRESISVEIQVVSQLEGDMQAA